MAQVHVQGHHHFVKHQEQHRPGLQLKLVLHEVLDGPLNWPAAPISLGAGQGVEVVALRRWRGRGGEEEGE